MVEMTREEYEEELEARGYGPQQPKKPSKIKGILKGLGREIGDAHRYMVNKRDEAARRNAVINKSNKRGKKIMPVDYNINHAHNKIKVGW